VTRRISISTLLLAGALASAGCATVRNGGPIRQVDQGLPAQTDLPEEGSERVALAGAQALEARGDAAGAAAEYAALAGSTGAAEWRVPLRHRAAELYLRAQRWEKAAEAGNAIVNDPKTSDPSRAVGARLVATAWLGAASAAVKAGQLEKLDLGLDGKEGPRPPAPPWKRFLDAADAYLARAAADPDLRRNASDRHPFAAELALVAAEVQYSYGELEDARRRLDAVLERWPADAELLEQAVPLYLATFVARGDRAGHAAALDRLESRIDAEAAKSPEKKASLSKVTETLARARAGAGFAAGEELLRAGKPAEAAKAFEAAAATGATDAAGALHNAAVAWDAAGEPAKAAAARERLLREHPDSQVAGEAALRVAAFRSRQGDHAGAARLYDDFLRRWPASSSRCIALRNVASELDRAEQGGEAAARYLAFGKDEACAKADPNIAARALVRSGDLSDAHAKEAYAAAVGLEGAVTDPEAKRQIAEAKKRLKRL
jgi:hypothetical protein